MTVADLIKILQQFPGEYLVLVADETGYSDPDPGKEIVYLPGISDIKMIAIILN